MDSVVERRVSFRMPVVTKVVCFVDEKDKQYRGILREFSITSLYIELDDCPQVGSKCVVDIVLEGQHSRLKIENIGASIIRVDDSGVAVLFDERLEWFALAPLYFQKMSDKS